MDPKLKAREELGLLLRRCREQKGWNRKKLAEESKITLEVIQCLEHGVVNPSRSDFRAIIKTLELTPKDGEVAGKLLNTIHGGRRAKFHLPIGVLERRKGRRR